MTDQELMRAIGQESANVAEWDRRLVLAKRMGAAADVVAMATGERAKHLALHDGHQSALAQQAAAPTPPGASPRIGVGILGRIRKMIGGK
jgi:hypothetical protein